MSNKKIFTEVIVASMVIVPRPDSNATQLVMAVPKYTV